MQYGDDLYQRFMGIRRPGTNRLMAGGWLLQVCALLWLLSETRSCMTGGPDLLLTSGSVSVGCSRSCVQLALHVSVWHCRWPTQHWQHREMVMIHQLSGGPDTVGRMQTFYGGSLTVVDSEVRVFVLLDMLQGGLLLLLLLLSLWPAADWPQL